MSCNIYSVIYYKKSRYAFSEAKLVHNGNDDTTIKNISYVSPIDGDPEEIYGTKYVCTQLYIIMYYR